MAVDLNKYLVEPKCETVDHVEQLDFSKLTGGPEVELLIYLVYLKQVTVDLNKYLVDPKCNR